MIKKGYIFILILFPTLLSAQHGNEWIDYDQTYYKFPITETGVYRLTYNDLNNAGFPVSSVDPRNIQIFGHENEVTLYAIGESDGTFDPSDYFEFYAEKPDGRMDSLIFRNPSDHVNKFYNYFGDTVNYFITWNTSIANKRYTVSNSSDYTSHILKPYVFTKKIHAPADEYRHGVHVVSGGGNNIADSRYVSGEGYFSGLITKGGTITATIDITNPYILNSTLSAKVFSSSSSQIISEFGRSKLNHLQVSHTSSIGVDRVISDETFYGAQVSKLNYQISNTDLYSGLMSFKYSLIDDTGDEQNHYSFAELEINYPHTTDFEGKSYFQFNIPKEENINKFRLDVTNVSGTEIRVLGISYKNNNLIFPITNLGTYHFTIPNIISKDTEFVMYSDEEIKTINPISLATSSGKFENYLDKTTLNNLIIITHSSFLGETLNYKQYRESIEGNSYSVTLTDVNQLYNQFGGGITLSPLSIRRFLKAAYDLWDEELKGVFVIGKGVNIATHIKSGKWGTRRKQNAIDRCFVPVLGEPASDNMFTVGLNGDWTQQDIPIGRYSAKAPNDVAIYLNKVKEYEQSQQNTTFSIEEKLWQKNVMHFIGGANSGEQNTFLGQTRLGKVFIEKPHFGAKVEEYLKDGNSSINPSDFNILQEKIRNGISIIQYFGHSNYSNGFDTNLDKPENWNNKGKYPIVIANGCNSGDLYRNSDTESNSEEYVVLKDAGAVAYISTTSTGYSTPLAYLTEALYREISIDSYGDVLGRNYANALSGMLRRYDFASEGIREKFVGSFIPTTIHGDPMIKANGYEKPELIIPQDGIYINPQNPTLQDTYITVTVKVYNIGKSVADPVKLELVRTFPNGQDSVYVVDIVPDKSILEVDFRMPIDHSIAGGLNRFRASVDLPSYVEELVDDQFNNTTTKSLVIFSDGIIPILPHEFAITPKSKKDLIASTYNPDATLKNYIIEIDTSDLFDSNWKRTQEVSSVGGSVVIENINWIHSLTSTVGEILFQDSVVYYWRTAVKDDLDWKESSFQYIKDKSGWEQAHFYQFKKNDFKRIVHNRPSRSFDYDNSKVTVTTQMFSNPTGDEYGDVLYKVYSNIQDTWGGYQLSPAILIAVIDPNTLEPWGVPKTLSDGTILNPTRLYGQFNEESNPVRGKPDKYFVYQQHEATQLQNIQTLIDAVPDGFFILTYTFMKTTYANWDTHHPGLYGEFQALGANSIVSGQSDNLFAFLAKKGDPSFTQEYYSAPVGTDKALHIFEAEFSANSIGVIDAPKAGPTSRWNSIYWRQNAKEVNSSDSSRLYVFGDNGLGIETLLIDTLMSHKDSIIDLYNLIDAVEYPYLRLKSNMWDKVTNTPAQINRWQIMYEPIPEASVEPSLGVHYTASNIVQEGEEVEFAVAFKNISEVAMDSVMIKYWIEDKWHNNHVLKYEKLDSLRVGESMMDTVYFNTLGYGGENTIWMEINTRSEETGQPDQLEQYHFNNFYQKRLIVSVDKENPIVDVTFDGAHIFDGDIVSPSPNIIIRFNDENQYLKMNADTDTSLFQVSMVYPNEIFEKQIYFKNGKGETVMQWYPASGKKNEFTIEYQPENLPDGIYTLKVQGTDKSNNLSGDLTYDVQFEVVNESSITHFYNYPNPFSTKTRFVFTLTGSQIPDDVYIQIMTITGKVVKQITQDDLGTLRIGKNVTDYFWNGTDDFGDVLANGVYLYRVVTKINGEEIKHRETSRDDLFKHNFGKLYIMR